MAEPNSDASAALDQPAPSRPPRKRGRPSRNVTPKPDTAAPASTPASAEPGFTSRRTSRGGKSSQPGTELPAASPPLAVAQVEVLEVKPEGVTPAPPPPRQPPQPPPPVAREQAQQAEKILEAARNQFEEAEQVLKSTRDQAATVKQHVDQTEHELRVAREYVETTKRQSKEARLEFQEAEQTLEAVRRLSSTVQKTVLPQVEQEFHEFRHRVEQARQEWQQTEQDFHRVQQEAAPVKTRFHEIKQELADAEQQLQDLRREIEEVRRLRQELQEPKESEPAFVPVQPVQAETPATEPTEEAKDLEVVYGLVRKEGKQERLLRYLNDAWAVEKALVGTLANMAREVIDPTIRSLLEEHRQVTQGQLEKVEARIRALGGKPAGGKGFFNRLVGTIWDALQRSQDAFDRTTQDLMKGFATEQFEAAMYEALRSYAMEIGDAETVQLAAEHLAQEQQAALQLWPLIAPTAARPAQVAEEAAEENEPAPAERQ